MKMNRLECLQAAAVFLFYSLFIIGFISLLLTIIMRVDSIEVDIALIAIHSTTMVLYFIVLPLLDRAIAKAIAREVFEKYKKK